jgi:hypothetical protein
MIDRLSLANALADANTDRPNAECIGTVIVRAIRNNAGAAPDLDQREPRIACASESTGIAEEQAPRIAAVITELIRLRHPAHG